MLPNEHDTQSDRHALPCLRAAADGRFQKVPGVRSAHVTLNPPEAHIQSDGPAPVQALDQAARSAGKYSVDGSAQPAMAGGAHAMHHAADQTIADAESKPSIYPLVLIVAYIAGTCVLTTYFRGLPEGTWSWRTFMLDFMAGFFLVFSFFKLLDLRGFADAYQSYDILARPFRPWALAYPFVELGLGVAYLLRWELTAISILTLIVMLIGSVGVLKALLRKNAIRCACLGTALNLPMTTVTLVEDLVMAAMAGAMLLWPH